MASTNRLHRSFRFSETTLNRLEARAHEVRETRTGLAERYVEEGLRMDEHPGIGFADGPAGRRAVILGTGLDVWEVVATVRQPGGSVDAASRYLELPVSTVRAAVRYYAGSDRELLALAARQRRAVVTENVADFVELHRAAIITHTSHFGLIFTSPRQFPRTRRAIGRMVRALDAWLTAHPSTGYLQDQTRWLEPVRRS
ncbi:MAG: DUF5615 family PIN-like protein [Chloroflexi bacterium]|nr:DUF5615 family PIN-like protein [Chloroflexota bacterium]